jgi:ABC-type nitrate/sulfonate/bicarbonate transport system permease component
VIRIDRVLVVVITLALIGVVLSAAVQMAERYALRWRPGALATRRAGRL